MLAAGDDKRSEPFFQGGAAADLDAVTNDLKARLGRAESEKLRIEEQLNAEATSWKRERRQLSDEIDTFRQELARTSAEVADTEEFQRDLEESMHCSRQFELKCKALEVEKESGRTAFEARIEDLESQIVAWIERSHNTHRSVQSDTRKLEAELVARKRMVEIESERSLRSEQVKWKKAQRVLESEIASLKKELAAVSVHEPSFIDRLLGLRR